MGGYDLDEAQYREEIYNLSDFGNLEQRLQVIEKFPLVKLEYKRPK